MNKQVIQDAPVEYEVKFFPVELGDIRGRLRDAGAIIKTAERLMRRCVFSQEANPGISCTYIRVRDEGDKVTLSAKFHATDGEISSQKEHEATVADFETVRQVLLCAGLSQTGYQENRRETWQMPDDALVEIETWPNLPSYIEIEGESEQAVKDTAEQLGLDWGEHIVDSNVHLYALHGNISHDEALRGLAYLTFNDNK